MNLNIEIPDALAVCLRSMDPGPSAEEIDENRREMFRGFADDIP
jgi:hypothetical protein